MTEHDERERILREVDDGAEKTIELLQELIRVPSVNPWFGDDAEISGEAAVQVVFERQLRELGATDFDRWEPDAAKLEHLKDGPGYYPGRDFTGRPNLVARISGSDPQAPSLMIQGHCDVVSVGSNWTIDPFGAQRKNGAIYGRGTVDMKGGMAAALGALAALRSAGIRLRGDVLIASVVDEEAGGMGTLALVDRGHVGTAGTIVPEATDLNIAPLCRGILWGRVDFHGRAGHIELERKRWDEGGAVDAIEYGRMALNIIARTNELWSTDPRKNHQYIPIPCQIRVAQLDAGEYPTTYAARCSITFNVQYLPAERDAHGLGSAVKAEVEALLASLAPDDEWFARHPPTVTWLVDADCGESDDTAPIVTATVRAAQSLGLDSSLQGCMSHTDMGLMISSGSPTINFGPGHMGVAHQADEHVLEEDLRRATAVMALTMFDLCG